MMLLLSHTPAETKHSCINCSAVNLNTSCDEFALACGRYNVVGFLCYRLCGPSSLGWSHSAISTASEVSNDRLCTAVLSDLNTWKLHVGAGVLGHKLPWWSCCARTRQASALHNLVRNLNSVPSHGRTCQLLHAQNGGDRHKRGLYRPTTLPAVDFHSSMVAARF